MNELINVTNVVTTGAIEFKDPRLTEATQQIRKIYLDAASYADDKNKEIAKILGRIKTQALYKADGYASVADYADKVFGFKKAKAYSLAAAGEMYNNQDIGEVVKDFSPAKLAELSAVSNTHIKDAVVSGKIKPGDTEQVLREYASKFKPQKSSKVKVLKSYTIKVSGELLENTDLDIGGIKIMEDWDDHFTEILKTVADHFEVVNVPKSTHAVSGVTDKAVRKLFIWSKDGDTNYHVSMVTYVPHEEPKKKPEPKVGKTVIDPSAMSIEELEILLAEKRGQAKAKMNSEYGKIAKEVTKEPTKETTKEHKK